MEILNFSVSLFSEGFDIESVPDGIPVGYGGIELVAQEELSPADLVLLELSLVDIKLWVEHA